jgi:hypothetical protein
LHIDTRQGELNQVNMVGNLPWSSRCPPSTKPIWLLCALSHYPHAQLIFELRHIFFPVAIPKRRLVCCSRNQWR